MHRSLAPGAILVSVMTGTLLFAVLCISIATSQPWLGVDLAQRGDRVVIRDAADNGPMAGSSGATLQSLGPDGGTQIAIAPDDIIEEPDTLGDGALMRRFMDRQAHIFAALMGDQVRIVIVQNGVAESRVITPRQGRPFSDLPWQFWAQIFVGVVGLSLGAWVVTLRQNDLAAWMLFLAGAGLALAAQSAAIYSTRELALGQQLLGTASRLNGIGTLSFGIGMVTLFLVYPKRLVTGMWLYLPAIVIGVMIFYTIVPDWPRNVPLLPLFVTLVMAVLLAAILAQVWANRRDPVARAMMGWFGLAVAIGAGGFVMTIIIPSLLGLPTLVAQSTAFLFFLIIYGGVALGVARYRLFDLADWSVGILYYAAGAALMLAVDALLVFGLALDRLPALSLSLAAVCLTYMPLRTRIAVWARPNLVQSLDDLYRRITDIANTRDDAKQFSQIQTLWADLFRPLSIRIIADGEYDEKLLQSPTIVDNGRMLLLPAVAGYPAFQLDYANQGARLFSTRDQKQAATISHLLDDTLTRHRIYIEGIATERTRINRDMHDNIGILLLSALHSPDADRKNSLIRQTLSDLREIVSNTMHKPWSLVDLLADLRAELSEVLEAAGITLDWQETGMIEGQRAAPQTVLTLRALLRESVSNALRHSGARNVCILISVDDALLSVSIRDDGHGFDPVRTSQGNGLSNLRSRLLPVGEAFNVMTSPSGTNVSATIELDPPLPMVAE